MSHICTKGIRWSGLSSTCCDECLIIVTNGFPNKTEQEVVDGNRDEASSIRQHVDVARRVLGGAARSWPDGEVRSERRLGIRLQTECDFLPEPAFLARFRQSPFAMGMRSIVLTDEENKMVKGVLFRKRDQPGGVRSVLLYSDADCSLSQVSMGLGRSLHPGQGGNVWEATTASAIGERHADLHLNAVRRLPTLEELDEKARQMELERQRRDEEMAAEVAQAAPAGAGTGAAVDAPVPTGDADDDVSEDEEGAAQAEALRGQLLQISALTMNATSARRPKAKAKSSAAASTSAASSSSSVEVVAMGIADDDNSSMLGENVTDDFEARVMIAAKAVTKSKDISSIRNLNAEAALAGAKLGRTMAPVRLSVFCFWRSGRPAEQAALAANTLT